LAAAIHGVKNNHTGQADEQYDFVPTNREHVTQFHKLISLNLTAFDGTFYQPPM